MDKKYDTGKPMVGLMKKDFPLALIAVAEVTSYGVRKYNQPGSWRTVENAFDRYEDALGRHDLASHSELCCTESGLTHLAHRAWNALATLQLMLEELDKMATEKHYTVQLDPGLVAESVVPLNAKDVIDALNETNIYVWVCSNCGVKNDNSNIYTCQRCGHRRC